MADCLVLRPWFAMSVFYCDGNFVLETVVICSLSFSRWSKKICIKQKSISQTWGVMLCCDEEIIPPPDDKELIKKDKKSKNLGSNVSCDKELIPLQLIIIYPKRQKKVKTWRAMWVVIRNLSLSRWPKDLALIPFVCTLCTRLEGENLAYFYIFYSWDLHMVAFV